MSCLNLCEQTREDFSGNVFPKYLLFKKTSKQNISQIVPVVIPSLLNNNLIFVCITPHLTMLFTFSSLYMTSTYYSKSLERTTRMQDSSKQFFVINQEL